jgi:hypothetical protein
MTEQRKQNPLATPTIYLLSSLFLLLLPVLSGAPISLGGILFAASYPIVVTALAKCVLAGLAADKSTFFHKGEAPFFLEFSLGICLINLMLMAMAFTLPGSIVTHYILIAGCVLFLGFFQSKSRHPSSAASGMDITHAVFVLIGVAGICYYDIFPYQISSLQVVFTTWQDVFLNASTLTMFSDDPRQLVLKEVWGTPSPVYHYASFLSSALYKACSSNPALNVTAALWLPLGLLTLSFAAIASVSFFGRKANASLALLALLVLPDTSLLPISHGFLSFHKIMRASPSITYGAAQCLLALFLVRCGLENRNSRVTLLGIALAVLVFFVKVQVAVFCVPLVFSYLIFKYPNTIPFHRRALFFLAFVLAGVGLLLLGDHFSALVHSLNLVGKPGGWLYAQSLAGWAQKPASLFSLLVPENSPYDLYPLFPFILVVSTFGMLLVWYGVLFIGLWNQRKLEIEDFLPAACILVYALAAMILPMRASGGLFEFQHRPFILFYTLLAVYCGGRSALLIDGVATRCAASLSPFVLRLCLLACLLVPFFTKEYRQYNNHSVIGKDAANYFIDRREWDCAKYIRAHSASTDVFIDPNTDPRVSFLGLSEAHALLPPRLIPNPSPSLARRIARNQRIYEEICSADTAKKLGALAEEHGVRWYLSRPPNESKDIVPLAWPKEVLDAPAFRARGYAVYDLSRFSRGDVALNNK